MFYHIVEAKKRQWLKSLVCCYIIAATTASDSFRWLLSHIDARNINPQSQWLIYFWHIEAQYSEKCLIRLVSLIFNLYMCSKCTISLYVCGGIILFPFRSLRTCTEWHLTLWFTMGIRGTTCGLRDLSRQHVFRLGSLIGLRQPRWLSGLMRSRVHSLWLLVDHCVLRNWDRILVRAVKGLISRAGMFSICPLLWQRDVKLQQTNKQTDWPPK